MALGFGFNKAKVLSSAEKFVQQGKLQNAIAEYEKVIKEDPKDLTVLNAIGDLYARVGQNDKAGEYFKKVGDQYAHNGFTVKAIAVYKKLTRVATSSDAAIKLAELYTQQGLFNDARTHYMQVADQLLRAGDNEQAARVFQKILELDPENTTTQSKLADLYIKLDKKEEARNIYYSAAEALYLRKAFDAADEALSRVLSLNANDQKALLLRGMIASESGDMASAIQYLEQVPDLDSRPDALRALLNAKLRTGTVEGMEALAMKLLTVHQDINGLAAWAEWQATHHREEEALQLYDQYADRFFSNGPSSLVGTLYPLISRIRANPPALERMLRLLQKAGDTSHINEVVELLAHAKVQSGDFVRARDLYKELSEQEPENPLHMQNYRQMLARLGEDTMSRPLTTEEGTQALMVEELEHSAPAVQQEYAATVEKAIEAALTDAELFISYNVPLKAIAPLETVLPVAPRDLRLNQRLASLYLRAGRYTDAVNACKLLSELYAEFGHPEESERYAEEAQKYSLRAGQEQRAAGHLPVAPRVVEPEPPPPAAEVPAAPAPQQASAPTVQEFVLDVPGEFFESPAASQPETTPEPTVTEFAVEAVSAEAAFNVEAAAEPVAETPPAAEPREIEIDVSHEWESMLTVEPEPAAQEAPPQPPMGKAEAPEPEQLVPEAEAIEAPVEEIPLPVAAQPAPEPVAAAPDSTAIEDKVQEIRFYISQGFWDMAQAALHDLNDIDPGNSFQEELRAAISSGEAQAAAAVQPPPIPTPIEPPRRTIVPEPAPRPVTPEPSPRAIAPEPVPRPMNPEPPPRTPAPEPRPPVIAQPIVAPPKETVAPAKEEEFVLELEDQPVPPRIEPAHPAIAAKTPDGPVLVPKAREQRPEEDILGELVSDLEESLGDFVPAGQPQPEPELGPVTASHKISQVPAASPVVKVAAAAKAATNGAMQNAEASSVLSDILSELQHDLGDDSAEAEDPETHYNLGIAFKEMGLLDEAIGELQKVCHAMEVGNSFSQPVQAYTWLAQCLVDKGVPEAAVRWYQSALQLPGLDNGSRCAIYYDLGSAYEASGDKKSALANFMEVYSSNIDFRDVAGRIKVLKS